MNVHDPSPYRGYLLSPIQSALSTHLSVFIIISHRARGFHIARVERTVTDIRESTKRAKFKDLPRSSASGELTLHFNYGKFTAVGINRYAERKPNNIARFFDLLHSRNEFTGALSLHAVLIVRYAADLRRYFPLHSSQSAISNVTERCSSNIFQDETTNPQSNK